jgi:hypothetical protein
MESAIIFVAVTAFAEILSAVTAKADGLCGHCVTLILIAVTASVSIFVAVIDPLQSL